MGLADSVFLWFFAIHIPATVLVDIQILIPEQYFPSFARELFQWYLATFKDPLCAEKPLWLQAMIFAELFFQLPFFFFAVYAFYHQRNWIRTPAIVYASHGLTQILPILAFFLFHPDTPKDTQLALIGLYAPFGIVPAWLLWHTLRTPVLFPNAPKPSEKRS